MPKIGNIFRSNYLRASDLNGGSRIVTLGDWREETYFGDNIYVLAMAGEDVGLRLTSALAYDIGKILGDDDIDNWAGVVVELYAGEPKSIKDRNSGEEKTIQQIRAREVPGQTVKPPPKPPAPIDDDILFILAFIVTSAVAWLAAGGSAMIS